MADERLAVVQSFFQRFFEGRVSEAVALLEPTVEYSVPGRREPEGRFQGREAVAQHLEKFLAMTERPIDVLKWDDWLSGTRDIAGVVRLELQRPGRVSAFRVVFLVEVSQANEISRVECFFSDPEALDRFLAW